MKIEIYPVKVEVQKLNSFCTHFTTMLINIKFLNKGHKYKFTHTTYIQFYICVYVVCFVWFV